MATATRLPLSWAGAVMADPGGTTMAAPATFCRSAATTATFEPAAAAKIGGVLPTAPRSTPPAFTASSSGGPEGNCAQVTLYGSLSSSPAAARSTCEPAFWSPILRVIPEPPEAEPVEPPPAVLPHAASTAATPNAPSSRAALPIIVSPPG